MSTHFQNAYVIDVLSDDHPGIVAAVGNAVSGMGGNIDSCSQTVVRGYFTLIMIASFPEPVQPPQLSEAIRNAHPGGSDLQVMARPFKPTRFAAEAPPAERFVITASGPDKPGVLLQFSQYLAGKDINIVDLYGDRTESNFVLISQVEVPRQWDIRQLQADLEEMGRETGFTVRLQHENIFVATNQLRLTQGKP